MKSPEHPYATAACDWFSQNPGWASSRNGGRLATRHRRPVPNP